jgi:hypothetical protein
VAAASESTVLNLFPDPVAVARKLRLAAPSGGKNPQARSFPLFRTSRSGWHGSRVHTRRDSSVIPLPYASLFVRVEYSTSVRSPSVPRHSWLRASKHDWPGPRHQCRPSVKLSRSQRRRLYATGALPERERFDHAGSCSLHLQGDAEIAEPLKKTILAPCGFVPRVIEPSGVERLCTKLAEGQPCQRYFHAQLSSDPHECRPIAGSVVENGIQDSSKDKFLRQHHC